MDALRPVAAVKRAILYGLGDVRIIDILRRFEVGNGARDLQDSVVGTGGETEAVHGAFQHPFAIR